VLQESADDVHAIECAGEPGYSKRRSDVIFLPFAASLTSWVHICDNTTDECYCMLRSPPVSLGFLASQQSCKLRKNQILGCSTHG